MQYAEEPFCAVIIILLPVRAAPLPPQLEEDAFRKELN